MRCCFFFPPKNWQISYSLFTGMFFSNNSVRHEQKNRVEKKLNFRGRMRICMRSPSIPSAQRAKFDPAVAKTPRVRHLAVWRLEMNRRELEPNVIVQGFANCASSPLLALWWNPVRLYSFSDRGSARFHIHYDYLAAVELRYYPPPFSTRRAGHSHKQTATPRKGLCWRDRDLFQ
jgi:hypothetical protein